MHNTKSRNIDFQWLWDKNLFQAALEEYEQWEAVAWENILNIGLEWTAARFCK